MTDAHAEKVANTLIGGAAAAAALYILWDSARRRALGRIVRRAVAASGPWLFSEVRQAWAGTRPGSAPHAVQPADPHGI
jgi:hypothetical protein